MVWRDRITSIAPWLAKADGRQAPLLSIANSAVDGLAIGPRHPVFHKHHRQRRCSASSLPHKQSDINKRRGQNWHAVATADQTHQPPLRSGLEREPAGGMDEKMSRPSYITDAAACGLSVRLKKRGKSHATRIADAVQLITTHRICSPSFWLLRQPK